MYMLYACYHIDDRILDEVLGKHVEDKLVVVHGLALRVHDARILRLPGDNDPHKGVDGRGAMIQHGQAFGAADADGEDDGHDLYIMCRYISYIMCM